MLTIAAVTIGFLLDLVLGDPRWLPHPVVAMGRVISWAEPRLRRLFSDTPAGRRRAGSVLAAGLPLLAFAFTAGVCLLAAAVHPFFGLAVESWLCYQLLATCELRRQSLAVVRALREEGLQAGRRMVGRIVGRDVEALDEAGVLRASVETVAENASDGVIAPLVFMMVGGAPLGMLYKAINTLDSMVGYKNERYLDFGRASAKLDDVANFLPSRFAALCMVAVAPLVGMPARRAFRVWRCDRFNHASPNSAQTEAAMAGALGLRLAGDAVYFGTLVHKPFIGEATRPIEREDVARANRLMLAAAVLALLVCAVVRFAAAAAIVALTGARLFGWTC